MLAKVMALFVTEGRATLGSWGAGALSVTLLPQPAARRQPLPSNSGRWQVGPGPLTPLRQDGMKRRMGDRGVKGWARGSWEGWAKPPTLPAWCPWALWRY